MSYGLREKTLSRREMLGTMGLAAIALSGCQSLLNKKLETQKPTLGLAYVAGSNRHTLEGHAESALRAQAITARLQDFAAPRISIPDRSATLEELLLVHDRDYIRSIEAAKTPGQFLTKSRWSPYGGPYAFEAASLAVGASIDLARAVADGKIQNGFALTRPPGHHARAKSSAGYCIFNNVAVATRALQRAGKRRIAIVDIDIHHGDGTEEIFYRDADVLYVSTHQNDWPYTGAIEKIGEGAGRGTNINIALPFRTGDAGLRKAYEEVVIPALRRFQPEIILVSAGFDTHWRDPQGSFNCSLQGLYEISKLLNAAATEVCQGKIAYILEGGYQLEALSYGVMNLVSGLANKDHVAFDPLGRSGVPDADVTEVLRKVRKIHGL